LTADVTATQIQGVGIETRTKRRRRASPRPSCFVLVSFVREGVHGWLFVTKLRRGTCVRSRISFCGNPVPLEGAQPLLDAPHNDAQATIDRGSRGLQRLASTSAMKRSTISLNSAGSSRLSTWPDLGKNVRPDAGRCFFKNRLGSTQPSSSSPQMISAGVLALLIAWWPIRRRLFQHRLRRSSRAARRSQIILPPARRPSACLQSLCGQESCRDRALQLEHHSRSAD
jgi:hypothetical protein